MTVTHTALLELRNDSDEAARLSIQTNRSAAESARLTFLLRKMNVGTPSSTATREIVRLWLNNIPKAGESRATDVFAGSQEIVYSTGPAGGYLVPNEFQEEIILGMAQFDPLLDKNLVNLDVTPDARPKTYPAWDLSTIAATIVSEGQQQSPGVVPTTSGHLLNGIIFKQSLSASIEFEQDSFSSAYSLMRLAYSVAFARGVGVYLATGSGSGVPQGILTGAANSGVTLSQTITSDVSATANDAFQKAYFSVNRVYRASPKCAWVLSDSTYMWLRSLTDKQARPLIEIRNDTETIMGKPVVISPSIPSYNASPSVTGKIVFGDLSHFTVRCTPLSIQRATELPGMAEAAQALYIGRMRVDSSLIDPTSGVFPPVCYINITP